MKEGFESEGLQHKKEYESLQKKMMVKMEGGFKNEKMQDSGFKMNWLS